MKDWFTEFTFSITHFFWYLSSLCSDLRKRGSDLIHNCIYWYIFNQQKPASKATYFIWSISQRLLFKHFFINLKLLTGITRLNSENVLKKITKIRMRRSSEDFSVTLKDPHSYDFRDFSSYQHPKRPYKNAKTFIGSISGCFAFQEIFMNRTYLWFSFWKLSEINLGITVNQAAWYRW